MEWHGRADCNEGARIALTVSATAVRCTARSMRSRMHVTPTQHDDTSRYPPETDSPTIAHAFASLRARVA